MVSILNIDFLVFSYRIDPWHHFILFICFHSSLPIMSFSKFHSSPLYGSFLTILLTVTHINNLIFTICLKGHITFHFLIVFNNHLHLITDSYFVVISVYIMYWINLLYSFSLLIPLVRTVHASEQCISTIHTLPIFKCSLCFI